MKTSTFSFQYHQLTFQELSEKDKASLDHARIMAKTAYAPYSNFSVGASVRLANGHNIGGNNQENAAYPSGLCAERVALFAAHSQFPREPVERLAVFLPQVPLASIPSPCGACRQVISEIQLSQKKAIRLLLMNTNETVWLFENANHLLPFSFNADHLQ